MISRKSSSIERMRERIANEGYLLKEEIPILISFIKKPVFKLLTFALAYSGRRISEMLQIKPEDIFPEHNRINWVIEKKGKPTKKMKAVYPGLITTFLKYIEERDIKEDEYIFKSPYKPNKPYTRNHAWRIIHEAGLKMQKDIHPHTLRHTYGIMLASEGKSFRVIMDQLDHSDPSTTMVYLQIAQTEIEKSLKESPPVSLW